jgi:hypothetical protein
MADELDLDEMRGNALNTLGIARVSMGDVDGLEDLEESLRLAVEHGSQLEIARTANNLGVMSLIAGRSARGLEVLRARDELNRQAGFPTWLGDAQAAAVDFIRGEWDCALRRLDASVDGGSPAAGWLQTRTFRAEILLARDDVGGFERDFGAVESAMDVPAEGGHLPGALVAARLALATDRRAEAEALVDWLLASAWSRPYGGWSVPEFALILGDLDRPMDPILEAERSCPRLPWVQAAAAVARGDLSEAAERTRALSSPPLEAQIRLRLAKRLLADGRREEADEQLELALDFWRSVGATRYIREAEALRSSRSAQSSA